LREVEVLRERLLCRLEEDPTLRPRDICVMTPDVEALTPCIEAVFGTQDAIPYRIADRSPRHTNLPAEALQRVLALAAGRLSAPDVMDTLALELVRARFDFDEALRPDALAAVTALRSADSLAAAREPAPAAPEPAPGASAEPAPSTEIASLLARLDEQARAYAKRPRVQRMTSASTRAAEDAAYLLAWTERVETVGNRNYPAEAKSRSITGDLRLLVAVRADGGVTEIRVLQSSGHAVLDNAAIRIVRLSSPFPPFPPELRQRHDLIEVIRTWQFRSDRLSAGS
jgi:TonB family protein